MVKESTKIVQIDHYKDIFNRSSQNFNEQKQAPNLILAVKHGSQIYPGAPVCQNFGHNYFYYTSSIMNCIYDCEYCYLQGMYPSAHIVIFVNLDELFTELEELLKKHPVYLCISYDTDLLALEPVLHYVHEWIKFMERHTNLTVELRTKSANIHTLSDLKPNRNLYLAWTLNPEDIIREFEHRTPSLKLRIKAIKKAMSLGYHVRLCFDPMIYTNDWKSQYRSLLDLLAQELDLSKISDISIGVFRISSEYIGKLRKGRSDSILANYPYENDHGVAHLPKTLAKEMISFLKENLIQYISKEKFFIWEETK